MAHNPPRPPYLDEAKTKRIKDDTQRQLAQVRRWDDIHDLARQIEQEASAGRRVILNPATASFVAAWLKEQQAKPTRDEVAILLCTLGEKNRCSVPCTGCKAKANTIVNVYGYSLERRGEQK